ncbi:MAG: putative hydrophobic protein (TIGR00341 family) [Halocynthiibacter sp.]|jgi:uncharacterized hydrophobic protein (TIGR00341 family)
MRQISVVVPEDIAARLVSKLSELTHANVSVGCNENGARTVGVVVDASDSQASIDLIQGMLSGRSDWQIRVLPVEATINPKHAKDVDTVETRGKSVSASREEIYQDVAKQAELSRDFIFLTVLSAIVAALGINADSVAVVIGAMVIAPLLGPLLAFSFGSALGDVGLMTRSARTAGVGLAIGFLTAFAIGMIVEVNLESKELLDRSEIGLDSIALALASGAAAALSVTTGLSSALVGVMVAVALLPPSVAIAMFSGAGEYGLAGRASLLLFANIVSVGIASQIVFLVRGIQPRTWREQKNAKKSQRVNLLVWGVLLIGLSAVVWFGWF